MGSWGYKPFESDDSRWLLYEIEELCDKKLKKLKFEGYNHTDILGAVFTVTQLGKAFKDEYVWTYFEESDALHHLHDLIVRIQDDEAWFDDWDDPAAMKRSVRKTRRDFENAFEDILYDSVDA